MARIDIDTQDQQEDKAMPDVLKATICSNGSCSNATLYIHETATNETDDGSILTSRDASWILTSAVIIFTMQTGFGLLEAGCVSPKSEINIMMKNALDVVFGGVTYWAFGFSFSFGDGPGSNSFIGTGLYFVDVAQHKVGFIMALFLFQLSFATTSTTIVSGAMAERTKLVAYNCFSLLNTIIYSIPAHWMWSEIGFMYKWGAIDIAGCGPVHLVGGTTGLIATLMIGPRIDAFDTTEHKGAPSPVKCILGMFMLWWGWLRFNSGSVFIVSSHSQWTLAVKAAVNTIIASMGGGVFAVIISLVTSKMSGGVRYNVGLIVNGVLGSLVSVTAICTMCQPWESFVIGGFGATLAAIADVIVYKLKIDDPVGVIPVHAVCSLWGLLAVGLFVEPGHSYVEGAGGLFRTGEFYLLGIQALSSVIIMAWTLVGSFIILKTIDLTIGLRLDETDERKGADLSEHGASVLAPSISEESIVSQLSSLEEGTNPELATRMTLAFKDFIKSCDKNELTMTCTRESPDLMTFAIKVRSRAPYLIDDAIPFHM